MSIKTSRFIVFEGIEGSGKSTVIRHLAMVLDRLHQDVVVTREPGGTVVADHIRSVLLHAGSEDMHPYTELCLLSASRAQHVMHVLKPAIARGAWILCDRFTDSSLAYQGYGRGIPQAAITYMNHLVTDGVQPDCVIVCDIDVEYALERIKKRRKDRIEMEDVRFFERIRQGYLEIAQDSPIHHVIDSSKGQRQVLQDVMCHLGLQDALDIM